MAKARVYVCCAVILLCVVVIISVSVASFKKSRSECPDGSFSSAAVAADSRNCSQVGRDILQRGGSAVDGAIAALLCTSVANAQSMGIGGGSMFTVMDSSGEVKIINCRETVPRNFPPDLLESCSDSDQMRTAARWIGVPGEIRCYERAHKLYGKLPWADLFQPTIKLAREGFPIPDILGGYLVNISASKAPSLRKFFSDKDGNLLKVGDIVKFEKLADTLEMIANHTADVFYTGRIAEDLIRDIREAGGTLTLQDLAEYNATVTDPWTVPLGEYQMYFPPPPGAGSLLSLIMHVMEGYKLTSASLTGEEKTLTYHRYAEALKFVSGLKKHIRDPRFNSVKMAKNLTEQSFADHIRSLIMDNKTHVSQYYNIHPHMDNMGTTHVSLLAEDGSAVSVTSTINGIFGSQVFSPSTGVILNNQLRDFCNRADKISPGERPPSSTAPSVLKSRSRTLVIGGSGGSMITTGIASALMNHLWLGKSLMEAIDTPVVFVNSDNTLQSDNSFDQDVVDSLKAMGHKHKTVKKLFNVVNAVEKAGSCITAVSDKRKLAEAAGY